MDAFRKPRRGGSRDVRFMAHRFRSLRSLRAPWVPAEEEGNHHSPHIFVVGDQYGGAVGRELV
jgi:hypothetical protein